MAEDANEANAGGGEAAARLEQIKSEIAVAKAPQRRRLLLEQKRLEEELRAKLSAIDRVRLARNPARPQTQDYIEGLVSEFIELHGDRRYADDGAIIAGVGYFGQRAVAIVGHQRGRSTADRIRRNFGKPFPEGYRKAARIFELADRFGLPLVTFIDTQGAEPGVRRRGTRTGGGNCRQP